MWIYDNKKLTLMLIKCDIQICDCGFAKTDETWHGSDICSPYSRLYFVEHGTGIIQYNGKTHHLESGYAYIIPAGLKYDYRSNDSLWHLYFHFNIYKADKYDLFMGCNECIKFKQDIASIKTMRQKFETGNFADALYIKNAIYNTVSNAIHICENTFDSEKEYSPFLLKVMDFIETNLSNRLSASLIAEKMYVSESKLVKTFKLESGKPLGKYIDDLVLFSAEKMLLKTDMSICEISDSLGFCDQFYFSRRFAAKNGESPRTYRKRMKANMT